MYYLHAILYLFNEGLLQFTSYIKAVDCFESFPVWQARLGRLGVVPLIVLVEILQWHTSWHGISSCKVSWQLQTSNI